MRRMSTVSIVVVTSGRAPRYGEINRETMQWALTLHQDFEKYA